MKRYSGQRALYEAMQRSRRRRTRLGLLERLAPQLEKVGRLARSVVDRPKLKIRKAESVPEKPAPVVLKPPRPVERHEAPAKVSPAKTWLRPKAVQFNAGRIEISLPWQLGVVIGLLVIVAVLVVYRLGQIDQRARYKPGGTSRSGVAIQPSGAAQPTDAEAADSETSAPDQERRSQSGAAAAASGQNDHMIVLAQYAKQEDLEQVQKFFSEHGVRTSVYSLATLRNHFASKENLDANVVPKGDGYMLVYGLCENPDKPGTNGYAMKQKIIELGARYKAPNGFESFASHRFSDAYGMKIK